MPLANACEERDEAGSTYVSGVVSDAPAASLIVAARYMTRSMSGSGTYAPHLRTVATTSVHSVLLRMLPGASKMKYNVLAKNACMRAQRSPRERNPLVLREPGTFFFVER